MASRHSIEIPGLPKSLNRVGSRGSAFAFHREKKRLENDLVTAMLVAKVPKGAHCVEATAVLYPPTAHKRDEGNFRTILEKALGDALQAGGWLPDDTPEHFTFGRLTFGEKRKPALTVVELVVSLAPSAHATERSAWGGTGGAEPSPHKGEEMDEPRVGKGRA